MGVSAALEGWIRPTVKVSTDGGDGTAETEAAFLPVMRNIIDNPPAGEVRRNRCRVHSST